MLNPAEHHVAQQQQQQQRHVAADLAARRRIAPVTEPLILSHIAEKAPDLPKSY